MIYDEKTGDEDNPAVEEPDEEEKHFRRYGVRIVERDAPHIRRILREQIDFGPDANDGSLMRLCCVQLFSLGHEEDILLIWRAKMSGFDAGCSIDVQLLCGKGLEATIEYLKRQPEEDAKDALSYLWECVSCGDFMEFSVDDWLRAWERYYSS